MRDWKILVVEDDPDGQEVVTRILRYHNIVPAEASTAEEALSLLEIHEFTAVITDLALPGMDGWTLLEKIKSDPRTKNLPCVAVTAYHSPELAVKAIQAGFAAYFPKPLEATSFVRELERVIV